MSSPKKEVLPVGVARVPKWWMEETPHHTLDLEEDEARKQREAEMELYYQMMGAAADAGLLGSDGKLALGPDGGPHGGWSGNNGWGGRTATGATSEGTSAPGGRNFKTGKFTIDPKLFGIDESDPDYRAYLTGAKLPPGFLEKMAELEAKYGADSGVDGIANNLKQTDFGKYGRQAEKGVHKPAWMKMKLRATSTGANIRNGQYNDSPSKHLQRRVKDTTGGTLKALVTPSLDTPEREAQVIAKQDAPLSPTKKSEPVDDGPHALFRRHDGRTENHKTPQPQRRVVEEHPPVQKNFEAPRVMGTMESTAPAGDSMEGSDHPKTRQVRRVRKVRRKKSSSSTHSTASAEEAMPEQAPAHQIQRQHYPPQGSTMTHSMQQHQRVVQPEAEPEYEQEIDEDYDEEEIIEDEYVEDGSEYEEELLDDEEDDMLDDEEDEEDLEDLQAQLAAKMAELARLQAQI